MKDAVFVNVGTWPGHGYLGRMDSDGPEQDRNPAAVVCQFTCKLQLLGASALDAVCASYDCLL